MPPQRTISNTKPLKTERTHEENQERAYIAASRRSDRSLEARVESARRASEIHKRRTGRSLRVTEQDVVNEEMYEEEDDDLPMQYRRLTAHLQTAMRSALDQAITNSYAQQYPNAPQFAHYSTMYPSPFMGQNIPQQQSPTSYGQPYPTPNTPGFRSSHPTSASGSHSSHQGCSPTVPNPNPVHQYAPTMDRRRTSASSKSSTHSSHSSHSPHGAPATSMSAPTRPALPPTSSANNIKQESQSTPVMKAPPQPSLQPQQQQQSFNMGIYSNTSPFTTQLPAESQMLLGSALDPNDPLTSMLMAGSDNMPQPFSYSSTYNKPRSFQAYDGMSATLAPSALDMSPRHHTYHQTSTTTSTQATTSPAFLGFEGAMPDYSKSQMNPDGNSANGSGSVTPGNIDGGWDAFINDNSWAENVT